MRVLSVGNMYPPYHYGGYELVWRAAVEDLRARGHVVRILTTDTRTDATEHDDPDVHRELRWALRGGGFERLGLRERVATARHNHRTLERHLAELAPDVVAWWSMGGLSLSLLEAVRRRALPAVAFVHDDWLGYGPWEDQFLRLVTGPRRGRLAPLAERLLELPARVDFGRAADYVFVSDFLRRRALAHGLDLERTSVAHSGIDAAHLEPAPVRGWGWRLLYVGRLDPRKGVDLAIEALGRLPPEASLAVVGGWDPVEEGRLRALAARLGVADRVNFLGHRSREDVLAAYDAADAVLFPVRWEEPWGLVPLEAMARGRPVIATGRGGSGEYLRHEQNCLLFDPDAPGALAVAVRRLAGDAELRDRLREQGLETARCHTEPVFNAAVEAALVRTGAGRAGRSEPVGVGG